MKQLGDTEDRRDANRETAKPAVPGLYLHLFHGRNSPEQDMEDWGFDGPFIGPLQLVRSTYNNELELTFDNVEDHDRFFLREVIARSSLDCFYSQVGNLKIISDVVEYEGKYYGDWDISYLDGEEG